VKRGQAALIFDTSLLETLSQNKSMTLREVTRAVINRVENVSGCPVVVSEDASLKTLAASRIARGASRIHAVSFNAWAAIAQNLFVNRSTIDSREQLWRKF
jgi:hypothetical protein